MLKHDLDSYLPNFPLIWADIPDTKYYGRYEVSCKGEVRNKRTGQILKPNFSNCGYLNVFLYDGHNKKQTKKIHRLVAMAFYHHRDKPQVNHKDCNKHNNHVTNLEWCTNQENQDHAVKNNLKANVIGINNPFSKLKNDDILSIRKYRKEGLTLKEISKIFNISNTNVSSVINFKSWKHIKGED